MSWELIQALREDDAMSDRDELESWELIGAILFVAVISIAFGVWAGMNF